MNNKNRYAYTGFFVISFIIISFYFIQRLITVYTTTYEQECIMLRKQYQDIERITQKNNQLSIMLNGIKKELQTHEQTGSIHDYFKKRLFFVLKEIKQCNLKLHSYGVQKERNYNWYIKEKAHIDISGTFTHIMNFFETIHNARQMISVSQCTLTRLDDGDIRAQCTIEFILLLSTSQKEIPSTVNKLKG